REAVGHRLRRRHQHREGGGLGGGGQTRGAAGAVAPRVRPESHDGPGRLRSPHSCDHGVTTAAGVGVCPLIVVWLPYVSSWSLLSSVTPPAAFGPSTTSPIVRSGPPRCHTVELPATEIVRRA